MNIKDRINIEIKDHVADVKLARSAKMNALDDDMFQALIEAGEYLHTQNTVRCIVLSGEGKAFTAGLDLSNFKMPDSTVNQAKLVERTHDISNIFQKVAVQWRELPVPVISAIHGICYGGGVQISSASDIRVIAPDARLSIMEVRWGIIPDMGASQMLRHYLRDDILRELSYTGRIFSGQEAHDYGYATHLDEDPHKKAMDIAKAICARNPYAVRGIKKLYNEAPYVSKAEGYLMESEIQDKIIGTPNQLEAVFSEMQKRPANFQDVD